MTNKMLRNIKKIMACMVIGGIVLIVGYFVIINFSFSAKVAGKNYYSGIKEYPSHRDKEALREYCKRMGLNTNYCILVNYSIPSGNPRFFIYDFNKRRFVYRCRCAHGLGGGSTACKAVFSNSNGSRCSSLGKFVTVGMGSAHYKNCIRLEGLDKSNNNAYKRGLLIHSAGIVTRHRFFRWMFLSKSCEGCFTITKGGLMKMHELYAKESNKKFLLTAYN